MYSDWRRIRNKLLTACVDLCQPALSKVYILLTVTLNIATDVYLLFIPLPMLWGARIKAVKKIGLIVLFSGAVFVMVAGLLRCILILQVSNPAWLRLMATFPMDINYRLTHTTAP